MCILIRATTKHQKQKRCNSFTAFFVLSAISHRLSAFINLKSQITNHFACFPYSILISSFPFHAGVGLLSAQQIPLNTSR